MYESQCCTSQIKLFINPDASCSLAFRVAGMKPREAVPTALDPSNAIVSFVSDVKALPLHRYQKEVFAS